MYILRTCDYLKVATRVDGIMRVLDSQNNECLNLLATLHFPDVRGPAESRVLLWAPSELESFFTVEYEFTDREVVLEGFSAPDEKNNPYARGSVGIKAIWFDNPSVPIIAKSVAQVMRDFIFDEDPDLLQFGDVTPLVKTRRDV